MNTKAFFDMIRESLFGGSLSSGQVDGIIAIHNEFTRRKLTDVRWLAYILATVHHETAKTFQPIAEYGKGKSRKYGKKVRINGKPYDLPHLYYGRGHVQLTWLDNYEKMTKRAKKAGLNYDFVNNPDLMLQMEPSLFVLFEGMIYGLFTGRDLTDYIWLDECDFENARRIINGLDKAELIEGYADKYLFALKKTTE